MTVGLEVVPVGYGDIVVVYEAVVSELALVLEMVVVVVVV